MSKRKCEECDGIGGIVEANEDPFDCYHCEGTGKLGKLSLYWCWEPSHEEDWFIVAMSEYSAASQHDIAEGFNVGDSEAKFVCAIPEEFQQAKPGWPDEKLLSACGGEYVDPIAGKARAVKINGVIYEEGVIQMGSLGE